MKSLITFLLVFTTCKSFGIGQQRIHEVFSQVCGYGYVKGTKVELPNGQLKWRCLQEDKLPISYEADVDVECSPGYTSTKWIFSSNHLHYKYCVLNEELGPDYETFEKTKCRKGYSSDEEIVFTDVLFDHKRCEKIDL